MPALHEVRLAPLEVLGELGDVVDALARRVARRQPQPRRVVVQLQVRGGRRLHDLHSPGIQKSFVIWEGQSLSSEKLLMLEKFKAPLGKLLKFPSGFAMFMVMTGHTV